MDRLRLYLMSSPIVVSNPRNIVNLAAVDDIDAISKDFATYKLREYQRLYSGIRRTWMLEARRHLSKRAYRRLRGKIKGLRL